MEVRVGIEASRVVDDTQVIEKIKRHNPQKLSKHSVKYEYTGKNFTCSSVKSWRR